MTGSEECSKSNELTRLHTKKTQRIAAPIEDLKL
jgi:hypothetical protein